MNASLGNKGSMSSGTDAPLSRAIQRHHETQSAEDSIAMAALFQSSIVGVIAVGAPPRTCGELVVSDAQPISLASTSSPDDQERILCFADPRVFEANFGRRFNATMRGSEVWNVVLFNPESRGVLVNSALAEAAAVIDRPDAEVVPSYDQQTWWQRLKFWWNLAASGE